LWGKREQKLWKLQKPRISGSRKDYEATHEVFQTIDSVSSRIIEKKYSHLVLKKYIKIYFNSMQGEKNWLI